MPAAQEGSRDRAVWRLAAALTSAVTTQDVARAVADDGPAATVADFASFAVVDPKAGRMWLTATAGLVPEVARRWQDLPLDESTPLGAALLWGRPVLRPGTSPDADGEYIGTAGDRELAGFRATAAFPLVDATGEPIGGIGFAWRETQRFDEGHVERLSLFAGAVRNAIVRALVGERDREQLSAIDQAQVKLLQDAFLPSRLPPTPGLEVAATYVPARGAPMGGDWYDVFAVEDYTFLVVGDVAGHGVKEAAVMAQLRNAIRAYAVEGSTPARILARVNRTLCTLEPEVTASAVVALWDPSTGFLVRANAGHPPVLRCRRGESEYLSQPAHHALLGAVPTATYRNVPKFMRPGTTLVFFTDGLVERRDEGLDQTMDDLLGFVQSLDDLSPAAVCKAVIQWRRERTVHEDDVCVLAVRITDERT
ncbi:MAG: PP2C family protein-serine/threonine phosphatase [Acidimicrobiales bacterium]